MEIFLAMGAGALALISAVLFNAAIKKKSTGNERMTEIAGEISKGAMAFLTREYKMLAVFIE